MRRLLVVGHGRMGRLVEQLAPSYGFEVAGVLDRAANGGGAGVTAEACRGVDVAVDFSTPEARMRAIATNLNTCHIWADDGEQVTTIRNGGPMEVPVWIQRRYAELGLDPTTWRNES